MQVSAVSIVAGFFEASVLPDRWPDALQLMADGFDCRGALLTTKTLSPTSILASHHMGDVLGRFHDQHWHERDLRTQAAIASPMIHDSVMRDQDILNAEQIEGSDYYRGFARPAGVGYFACALLDGGPADFVAISLQRDQRRGFVSDADRARLQEMLPALQRSVRLARGLRERSIETLFDNQADDNAVQLLLDADGRVRRGEGAAAFLERLGLRIAHGFLMGRDARSDVAIARALAAVGGGVASEMLVMDACGLPLAKLGFSPVAGQAHDLLGRGDALVRVAAIDQPWRDARLVSRLAQLFSLTAAEQRVLLPLLSGAGTEEIAQASGYTRESVRTWMKSILFKSGCNSRAALLALARRLENG